MGVVFEIHRAVESTVGGREDDTGRCGSFIIPLASRGERSGRHNNGASMRFDECRAGEADGEK